MNTVFINSDNYDFYSLELPFNVFIKGKKNIRSWIVSNLERLHPRFMQQCDCDYKIRFNKLKLFAKILVLDKFLLINLQSQKAKRIGIKQKHNQYYFCKPNLNVVFFAGTLVLLLGMATFILQKNKKSAFEQILTFSETNVKTNNAATLDNFANDTATNESTKNTILQLFEEINAKQIPVHSIDFKIEDNFAAFTLVISKIFPDEIIANFAENGFIQQIAENRENGKNRENIALQNTFFIKEVSYTNNIPHSVVKVFLPLNTTTSAQESNAFDKTLPKLRNAVLFQNGTVTAENLNNSELCFSFRTQDFLSFIDSEIFENVFEINAFSVNAQNEELHFCVTLSEFGLDSSVFFNKTVAIILKTASKTEKSLKSTDSRYDVNNSLLAENSMLTEDQDILLGKMTDSSGQMMLILKSKATGKIYTEVINEKVN